MNGKFGFSPLGKHPKPKSKGKKPKPPKLKTGKKIPSLDVFFTSMEADAGSESSKKNYADQVKKLSKGQLSTLEKLIRKIRRNRFSSEQEDEGMEHLCDEIEAAIEDRIQQSQLNETSLMVQTQEKLSNLNIQKVELGAQQDLKKVYIDNRWMSLRRFIHRYFYDELEEAKELLEDGQLITPNIRHGPYAFLKRCIRKKWKE